MDEMYDYRRTCYCPELIRVKERKVELAAIIKEEHPGAEDMHNFISDNSRKYKRMFMQVYNAKCAYCGVTIDLNPLPVFEIDHFLYEKAPVFKTKKEAGYIENLVFACHDCNHRKSSFWIDEDNFAKLYPDEEAIKSTFVRDEDYYIRISEGEKNNPVIVNFYEKLQLGSELHRLDYLLMSVIGMKRKHQANETLGAGLGKILDVLITKRNTASVIEEKG